MINMTSAQRDGLVSDLHRAAQHAGLYVSEHDVRAMVDHVVSTPAPEPLDAQQRGAVFGQLQQVALNRYGNDRAEDIQNVLTAALYPGQPVAQS